MRSLLCLLTAWLLTACTGLADGIRPVTGFQLDRYLGTWYEIARLDHSFERGLERVSATYSRRDDGGVKVLNRGLQSDGSWREAEGKAYFVGAGDKDQVIHATLGADAQYLRERFDHAFPALRRLPLSERISDAIVLRSGPYAPALQIACALETDDASVVRQLCETHEMDTESVNRALLRLLSELHVERPRPGQPTGSR